jgi:hypothetical protein
MMSHNDHIHMDFHRLFEKEETCFDADEFIQYVEAHNYTTDYDHLKAGFIREKLDEEYFAYEEKRRFEVEERARKIREENEAIRAEAAAEAEAKMKERARRVYPFSDAAFEKDWDNHLRAQYAAQRMNTPPANPRDYQYGLPGYYSQSLKPMDVSEQPLE